MDDSYLVGLIGAGVDVSLTPSMHMAEAVAHGIAYVYRTIDLTRLALPAEAIGDLLDHARALGFDALNVTHPCKQLVLSHLDEISPTAAALGAVNTVLFGPDGRATGHNTDTTGFEAALRTELPAFDPTKDLGDVVMLGAGGAGAAVGDAMARLGADHLVVVDVDEDRATALSRQLGERHPRSRIEAGTPDKLPVLLDAATGIVHCTPTGMAHHPGLPLDPQLLTPRHWVADIVYRPLDTALLQAARQAGCRTLDGGHMAVHQAVDAFRLITGTNPDAGRMARHFRSLVARDAD